MSSIYFFFYLKLDYYLKYLDQGSPFWKKDLGSSIDESVIRRSLVN